MGKIYRAKNDVAIDKLRELLDKEGFVKVEPIGKIWRESYRYGNYIDSPEVNIDTTGRRIATVRIEEDDAVCEFLSSSSDFISPRLKLS